MNNIFENWRKNTLDEAREDDLRKKYGPRFFNLERYTGANELMNDMIKWVNFYIEIRTNQVRISAPFRNVTNMKFQGKNQGIEITIKSNDFTPTEILTMLQYGTEFVSTFKRYSQF